MRPGFLLSGTLALVWGVGGSMLADTLSIPVVPASLWKGGGQDVEVSATRAEPAGEPEAILFRYALLGGRSEYGYAEYLYQNAVPLATLPKGVQAELIGEAGGAMVSIRFIDAEGTIFQWNLSKVDFTAWQPVQRKFRPAEDGYVAFGPKVKESTGGISTFNTFPLVPPFKLYSLLLQRRFQGDDERRSFSLRHLEIEY